jgi:TolB-like protein/DNA-binding winged helix-turn-helix (wHTH) protein
MHGGAMIIRGASSSVPAKRLRFDGYVLDLERGCLLLGEKEIALRPKTFAVLHHLIENAGRLVPKDELFAAVWPNLAITDDALVQSIGEIRRALGDEGRRLIRTIPRRGYRFESDVSVIASTDRQSVDGASLSDASHDMDRLRAYSVSLRTRLGSFKAAPAAARVGSFALFMLSALLAAGMLWHSAGVDGGLLKVLGYGDQPAAQGPETGAKPAIAVLPLVDQGNDPARAYFADGLTQDIINALGRFSALTVVSWNAVLPYKGNPANPEEIRRRIGVRYLVEGSVRRIGDQMRMTSQLVDTMDGRVLWSGRFDEALADVFALQDTITNQIVSALALRVAQIEQRSALAKPTESLEAYDYALRARPALQRPTRTKIVEARALLRRAIDLDPGYAAAYAALAETYYVAPSMGWAESPTASLSRAEDLANKALSLDYSEVRARVVLGRINIFRQRYQQAEAEIERAIAINPNDAQGLAGRGNIMMWLGKADAAIAALEQAQRIDPDLNAMDRFALSLAYYLKRRYKAAIEQAEINLREGTGIISSRIVLAAAYGQHDQTEDAVRVAALIRRTDPTFDPEEFGTKFLNSVDLDHFRDGLRKAGLYPVEADDGPAGR